MGSLFGVKVCLSDVLMVSVEDWSKVRSPGRARRRRKLGYRQNVQYVTRPDPSVYSFDGRLVMHPVTWHRLQIELEKVCVDQVVYGTGAMIFEKPGAVPRHVPFGELYSRPLRKDGGIYNPFAV